LLFSRSVDTVRQAITAVQQLGFVEAAGALDDLARTTSRRALRQEALAAAAHLRDAGRPGFPELPPVYRALASLVDGAGAQLLLLCRRVDEQSVGFATFMWQDDAGLRQVLGTWRMPAADFDNMLTGMEAQDAPLVGADVGYLRAAVQVAKELTVRHRKPYPPECAAWELLLGPPGPEESPARLEAEMPAWQPGEQERLLEAAPGLLARAEFINWFFDADELAPHTPQVRTVLARRPRFERVRTLGAQIADAALPGLASPEVIALLAARLRRQARLLQRRDEHQAARIALAVAATLGPPASIPPERHPFLREMVVRGVAAAAGYDLGFLG
jgi:hypothetical protein